MSGGFFGSLFDMDGDGKMSALEHATEFMFVHHMLSAEKAEEEVEGLTAADELALAGLDMDELCWMDAEERDAVLEEAGLDPEDFADEF